MPEELKRTRGCKMVIREYAHSFQVRATSEQSLLTLNKPLTTIHSPDSMKWAQPLLKKISSKSLMKKFSFVHHDAKRNGLYLGPVQPPSHTDASKVVITSRTLIWCACKDKHLQLLGSRHSTALLTQLARVRFSAFPRFVRISMLEFTNFGFVMSNFLMQRFIDSSELLCV